MNPSEEEEPPAVNNDFFPEEAEPMVPPPEEPKPFKGRGPVKTTWMFTVPNYTEESVELLQKLGREECVYMCFGKEIAPTTGTPHLQGFCILKRKQYYTYFKTIIGKQIWPVFWRVRGSPEANKKYCSKTRVQDKVPNEWFWESGPCPKGQGRRTDLDDFIELAKEYGLVRAVQELPGPYIRYHQGLMKALRVISPEHAMLEAPRSTMPHCTYIYGADTGTGKSAMSGTWPQPIYYVDKPTGKGAYWFDGYIPLYHKTVVFEEVRGADCKLEYLLRLLDRKPMQVQYKGGFSQLNSPYIVMNSNVRHSELYMKVFENHPKQVQALGRRFACVIQFTAFREYTILKGAERLPEGVHMPELDPPMDEDIVYLQEQAPTPEIYAYRQRLAHALRNLQ